MYVFNVCTGYFGYFGYLKVCVVCHPNLALIKIDEEQIHTNKQNTFLKTSMCNVKILNFSYFN